MSLRILLLAGSLALPLPALAQLEPAKESVEAPTAPAQDPAPTPTPAPAPGDEPAKPKRKILVVPVPFSNPTVGTGLAIGAVAIYNPNDSVLPWVSGGGALYTSTDTRGAAIFQRMSFGHDRVRIQGLLALARIHDKYYGIGPSAGDAGVFVDMDAKNVFIMTDAQTHLFSRGILRHLLLGGRFAYRRLDSTPAAPPPDRPDLTPPSHELNSSMTSIGPSFTFDSRDNSFAPHKGVYVTGFWLFGTKALGGDFKNDKFMLDANVYFGLGKNTVLAISRSLCTTSGDTPFYNLCEFGQGNNLRGYESGRYRWGASWALQAEVRQHLTGRFGAVGFFGVGGIAEKREAILKDSTTLTSGGIGVRYLVARDYKLNLRFDVAVGKNGPGVYLGIGEAF